MKMIPSLLILAAVASFISCTPKENENGKAAPAPVKTAAGNTAPKASKSEKAVDAADSARIGEPEGRDFLLYTEEPEEPVMVYDFEIGRLQGYMDADDTEAGMIDAAEAFFDSIIAGKPDYGFVAEEKKDFVMKNMEEEVRQAIPESFRLGAINRGAEPPRAPVRFEKNGVFCSGWVYFKRDKVWKIHDLQADFSVLNKKKNDHSPWYPYNKAM